MKLFLTVFVFGIISNSFVIVDSEISAAKFVEYIRSDKLPQNRTLYSELCAKHLKLFANELDNKSVWSLLLYDAWGSIPTGLYSGQRYDFGNFDQCLRIKVPPNLFIGQYCLVELDEKQSVLNRTLRPNTILRLYSDSTKISRSAIGICVPDSCNPDYLYTVFNAFLDDYKLIAENNFATNCYTNETSALTTLDIFAIALVTIILGTMILSTIYDYIVIKIRQIQPNRVLSLFSVYTNSKTLFSLRTPKSGEVIDCINGIRVLSLIWIILSHSYVMISFAPKLNESTFVTDWIGNPVNMLIISATLAIDSFFLLGGFMIAESAFRELDTLGHLNIVKMYLHRLIRITPIVASIVLFVLTFYKYLGRGPLWNRISSLIIGPCERNWWSTLIYLQNYLNPSDICIAETWYLAVDLQLFILSPLILYPLWKWKSKFVAVLSALILAGIIYVFLIIYENGFVQTTYFGNPDSIRRNDMIYYPTHARFGAWIVGVLLAYVIRYSKSNGMNSKYILFGWFISLGTLLAVLFGPFKLHQPDYTEGMFESPFYEPVSRVAWAISIGWIIYACHNTFGGPINTFLTMPIWRPLARLSFCMFLLHRQIQVIHVGSSRTEFYFSNYEVWYKFFGDISITIFVSTLWALAFEIPIINFLNIIFKPETRRPPPIFIIPQINIIGPDNDETVTISESNSEIDPVPNIDYLHLRLKQFESRTDDDVIKLAVAK